MRDIASIIGLKVISIQEGREVGEVSQVIVDLSSGAIEGMIIGTGATEKGLVADDIQVIGTDAVMIATYRLARPLSELPELLEKRRDVDAAPRPVITDTGKRLGTLGTIYIDSVARCVTRYEISGGAWRDMTEGVLSMAPVEGTVDGRDSLVIPAALLVSLGANSGGLKSKIEKLGESAKQQSKQVAEKATQVGSKLREEAAEATSKVKEEASELGAKLKEGAAKAGEVAQNLGEKVKEEASEASEKLREGASAISARFQRENTEPENTEENSEAQATEPEQTCSCCCEAPAEECVCTPEECAECECEPCVCEPCCECGMVICEVCGCNPCTCEPDCECGVTACGVCGCDPCECTPCCCSPCTDKQDVENAQENEDGPEKSE